jgi:tetratricopeptide (TPR) repeat protein
MKLRSPLISLLSAWSLGVPALGKSAGLEAMVAKSQAAMEGNRWEDALDFNKRVISRYGQENPNQVYGAQFGAVYFRKGICEMKLKRWDEAMRSFEICYRDFPNAGADRGNVDQKMALLKWGEAAMGAQAWAVAIQRFSKFTEERDRQRDTFPQGAFYISLAVCHYRLGHLPEGNENLEIAIRNKADFPTPDSGIIAGFQVLVETAITHKDEQALLDFIGKNRGELTISPDEMHPFSTVFLKLAGDALAAEMQRAAVSIYQFVPDTADDITEPIKLRAMALIHEKCGNVRGAAAAYRQVERYFPKAPGREDDLYHLVRTAVLLGEEDPARLYAGRLRAEFPDSARLGEIREAGIDSPETRPAARPLKPVAAEPTGSPLPKTPEFSRAMDLYQGRKYLEAKLAFLKIHAGADAETALFAKFFVVECLRKLGDLEGLEKSLESLEKKSFLGATRLRQLEIDSLWDAVRTKSWALLEPLAQGWLDQKLPSDQRAQVALCHGLALENLGHPTEALDAYHIAMTADAGASEEIVREAALKVLRIHHSDPEVQAALAGTAVVIQKSPGLTRLQEAAAVAYLFDSILTVGTPLPLEFRGFLEHRLTASLH